MGNPVPEDWVGQTAVMNVNRADNIAQKNIIYGLYEKYGDSLSVISVVAGRGSGEIDLGRGVKAQTISSWGSNRPLYYVSIAKNYIKKLNQILDSDPKKEAIVITAGPYVYLALSVLLAKRNYRVKWIPFLVGAIEVPEEKFPFSLISKMSRWTVKKADGAITYVANSALDYMPEKPFTEIVYQIDNKIMNLHKESKTVLPNKFTIAYTGALTSIYNIDTVIEVIKKTGSEYRWIFAGGGQYADEIRELAVDKRYDVEYLGLVSNIDAVKLQKSCHLLLCLRGGQRTLVNQYYSRYAASGKLTEYLCSGTPILAGDIPAFSDEYRLHMTCDKTQTSESIAEAISCIKTDYQAKCNLAKSGQKYAFKHFNAEYQNEKIYTLLESI